MDQPVNNLSVFDGISGGQNAWNRLFGDTPYRWIASEIDQNAMDITNHNYPNTIQVGDVRNLEAYMFPYINILMGGSPCQSFSFAGKRKGMTTTCKIKITTLKQYMKLKKEGFEFEGQSYLFWEFVRLVKEIKPKYFLLENVRMNKKWARIISDALGVEPIKIESSLVSAQNRTRLYWTNIPGVTQPEDKGIMLSDLIPGAIAGHGRRGRRTYIDGVKSYPIFGTTRKDGKSNALLTKEGSTSKVEMLNGDITKLPIEVWEQLQTLPVGYTDVPGMGITARKHGIGNGWTIDVITHILSAIPEAKKQPSPVYAEMSE